MWGTKLLKRTLAFSASLGLGLMLNSVAIAAVPTLEVTSASGNTSTIGPTTSPQTNTYLFNPDNPTANTFSQNYFPKTTVTYSLENQQYPYGTYTGLFFGDNAGDTAERRIFIPLGEQGAPRNNDFTSSRLNPSMGTGISITENYGTRIVLNASKLGSGSLVTSGLGIYFGDVVVTFNRPVKNPVINLSGMGGSLGNVGITANFRLKEAPSGTSIRLLSGRNLLVSGNDIQNTSRYFGATTSNGGASGSVQVENSNTITTLKFSVYLATDTSYGFGWGSSGDAFLFSASSVDSMVGDLVVSKTNGTNQVYSGGTTTYTVRVTNNGPDTYTGTKLTDTVGTGLTATAIACSIEPNNKCTTAPNLNSLASGIDTGSLAAGEFYEVLVTARVNAAVGGTVRNTAMVEVPTLGSSTGASCTTLNSGGITRSFNQTTGMCTTTDQDDVLAAPDLQISKTANKANYQAGEVVTYTIRAWNNSTIAVNDAVVKDLIPTKIAGLSWKCTANGTSTCPAASAMLNPIDSNNLNSTEFKLAANGSSTANYVEFVVTGLAYKEGDVTNTATVSSATLDTVEVNKVNNSASADINISTNTPNISGPSQNQCSVNQSVNLVSDTIFRKYDTDNTSVAFDNNLKTAGASPTVLANSVIYGTGPNGALQVKGRLSWSYGHPRKDDTGSTMKIFVDGTAYAILVTPAKSSNTTASFHALNGAQVGQAEYALTSYWNDPGPINFTITLPTSVTSVKEIKTEFQSHGGGGLVGDDISIGFNELNACLKPTLEMSKVSEGGVDSFNFNSFDNLTNANAESITSGEVVTTLSGTSQSVRLKSSSGGQGSLLAYATPNAAIRFSETSSTLYALKSVECIDTNTSISGNTSGNVGSLSGLTQTIPAAQVKFASRFICRVTNSKSAGYVFSGRVFNDNSGTTLDASKAYNAMVDAGELGIAGSVVELQDCNTEAVLASASSNANGDFKIQTLQDVFSSRSKVCLVQHNVNGYESVSAKQKDGIFEKKNNDLFQISKVQAVTSYEGFLFGDAELQLLLTQNGQKTIVAGDVVDYPHTLTAKSVMKVESLTQNKEQQPANNQPWQSLVYVDINCNAQLEQGEGLFTSHLLSAHEKVCLIQRVVSPTTAQGGDRFIASFKVSGKATYADATLKDSQSVNDITTIGTAGLNISKLVRKTSACPALSSDSMPFTVTNQAAKGDYLEYQISYSNNSNKNLVDVVLKDSVPVGTVFGTMSCTATGCQTQESSGQLKWTIPGVLAPKHSGKVGFCVQIPK